MLALGSKLPHVLNFLLGQQPRMYFRDANLPCHFASSQGIIAGKHDHAPHSNISELCQRRCCGRAGGVG